VASFPLFGPGLSPRQWFGCVDVLVGSVPLAADDRVHVRGISLRESMRIDPEVASFQLVLEHGC